MTLKGKGRKHFVHVSRRTVAAAAALLVAAALFIAYYPGLHGPFVFDDEINLHANPALAVTEMSPVALYEAASTGDSGPFGRPVALLSFALNHYFAGSFNAFPLKTTNLIIHLVNTWLVYLLATLVLRRLPGPAKNHPWLPWAIAAAWALHPLHLTAVLYVVQRMTSLAALFVLAGLIVFLHGRERIQNRRPSGFALMAAGLAGGTVLGALSKENAVVILGLAALLEWVLYDRRALKPQVRTQLHMFYALAVLLPTIAALAWLALKPEYVAAGYKFRDFTLIERLLTQPRVLWFYASLLIVPSTARLTLFHDDIAISHGLWEPWTTSVALVALFVTIGFAIVRGQRNPLVALGVLWFVIGHSVEASVIGLEIAHEHRNYLPDIGLILAGVCGANQLLHRYSNKVAARYLLAVCLVTLATATWARATLWESQSTLAEAQLRNHPRSARAHAMMAELYAGEKTAPVEALKHYMAAYDLAPMETGYLIRMVILAAESNVTMQSASAPHAQTASTNGSLPPYLTTMRIDGKPKLGLARELQAKIDPPLHTLPISVRTEQMLIALADCVSERSHCAHLYPNALAWLTAARANARANARVYNNLTVVQARIMMSHGDLEQLLAVTNEARHRQPDNPNFILMEAHIHFLRGETARSRESLTLLQDRKVRVTPSLRQHAEALAEKLRADTP